MVLRVRLRPPRRRLPLERTPAATATAAASAVAPDDISQLNHHLRAIVRRCDAALSSSSSAGPDAPAQAEAYLRMIRKQAAARPPPAARGGGGERRGWLRSCAPVAAPTGGAEAAGPSSTALAPTRSMRFWWDRMTICCYFFPTLKATILFWFASEEDEELRDRCAAAASMGVCEVRHQTYRNERKQRRKEVATILVEEDKASVSIPIPWHSLHSCSFGVMYSIQQSNAWMVQRS
ncbi:hypothetical protein ACP70R_032716 [Stipagrostis hirtigluma subsp. patula]